MGIRNLIAIAALLSACSGSNESAVVERGAVGVGTAGCAECHAEQADLWRGSHHDLAMQHAAPETVLGDFDAEPLTWSRDEQVHRTSFRQEQGRFYMTTEAPVDGAHPELGSADTNGDLEFEILFTFGVEPLQQYLVEFPGGALQCLPIAWDTQQSRWFHLDEEVRPGDALHWTGRLQSWNTMCAECHSTGLQKGYEPASDSFTTSFAEIDVGCIACHGEAEQHAKLARNGPSEDFTSALNYGFGTGGDPARLEINNCAHCHSRRANLTGEWEAGQSFFDHFSPSLLDEGLYFPDGQIQDEVFVWGSFTQSRMHAAGVTCSDCHDPHSLQLKVPEGPGNNGLCLQCHSASPPTERFPTLAAKDYQDPLHHGHALGTEGARCTTCHMPERTYMKVDPRRDHSMGVPRPDLSLDLGTPNACATCHGADHDDAWAAAAIARWVEAEPRSPRMLAQRQLDTLVATAFSRSWKLIELTSNERADTHRDLSQILASAEAAPLQRATSLDLLARFGAASMDLVVKALDDRDALVRAAAARALRQLPQTGTFGIKLRDLHTDPVRMVRVAAAEPEDFRAYLQTNADFPSSHFESGLWAQVQGRFDDAESDWRRAIELDPDFMPAVYNLSVLLSAMRRGAEAAELLQEAVLRQPNEGDLHYSLALQLAELQDSEGALASFQRAAVLLPERPRIAYNLGLIHSKLGQSAEAERELRRAIQLESNPAMGASDATYALAIVLLGVERYDEARSLADELQRLGHQGAGPLLEELARRENPANRSAGPK
jgi:tetratricopeptide (TPR) repeat protein